MENPKFDEICKKSCKKLTENYLNEIGKKIKKMRLENNLTQADVGFYIFSDKSLISSIERGVQKNVNLLTLIKISELFNISLEELIRSPL